MYICSQHRTLRLGIGTVVGQTTMTTEQYLAYSSKAHAFRNTFELLKGKTGNVLLKLMMSTPFPSITRMVSGALQKSIPCGGEMKMSEAIDIILFPVHNQAAHDKWTKDGGSKITNSVIISYDIKSYNII